MTKLEQKLIELGYEKENQYVFTKYIVTLTMTYCISIELDINRKVETGYVDSNYHFEIQQEINDLQQAFNEMQKDLEILKGCEKYESNS